MRDIPNLARDLDYPVRNRTIPGSDDLLLVSAMRKLWAPVLADQTLQLNLVAGFLARFTNGCLLKCLARFQSPGWQSPHSRIFAENQ